IYELGIPKRRRGVIDGMGAEPSGYGYQGRKLDSIHSKLPSGSRLLPKVRYLHGDRGG
ncbi:hypothetical protein BGX26_007161, partial [Mortierella sp. AD094]